MHTFLPSTDFAECARFLDGKRLNSQLNECIVILRSLARVYKVKSTGLSGWEGHTVPKMWSGHELQLGRYALAIANEFLSNRPLPSAAIAAKSLAGRRKRYHAWLSAVEFMEENNFPDTLPSLIGDEKFHSGFRSLLLFKDIQAQTFYKWKRGEYPDHACIRGLLPRKASWRRDQYFRVWAYFGMPDSKWYGQFDWKEEPNDRLFFYSEDRISQMDKEIERKKLKPFAPFYKRKE